MSSADPDFDFSAALDPARSAVVEACAGSGKTWLLASRIVRLLLAGAAPAEILAITFTRKAAREIEERVVDWLRHLATASDEEVRSFLAARHAATDAAAISSARSLYERVTGAQPGLAVNTFHGWFLQLVAVAPLSADLAGTSLAEDGSRRFEELWQTFARKLQRNPSSDEARAFVRLLGRIGLASTRTLMRRGMARRSEWLAMGDVSAVFDSLRPAFGDADEDALLPAFFAPGWDAEFLAYLGFLETSDLDSDRAFAATLLGALAEADHAQRLVRLAAVLLTERGTLRVRKPSKAMDKRFGVEGAQRFLDLHAVLGERLRGGLAQLQDARNLAFNRDAVATLAALLEHLDEFKAARRQIDFVDAEWRVLEMLRDDEIAAFIQARLDARYRHVLLDEFQDTNPLQWQILIAWLEAYTDASRPSVFLVGDPKQSIYRFRGAEPRLFATAASFLAERFAAVRLAQDRTRRNAPAIVEVVNAMFGDEPVFQPFRPQASLAADLPGGVELLPLCVRTEEDAPEPTGLRNPLCEAAPERIDARRRDEAEAMATRLAGMFGRVRVRDGGNDRPLRYGDVLLLVRKRTDMAIYERALAAHDIPFAAASRGGLLEALEVRDVVALLEFLVTPAADLLLAHALKSPLFACADDDLLRLAAGTEASWWARLQAAAGDAGASAALRRAAALISAWLPASAILPAHDLLDRIYHQGRVMARYRRAVPDARRAAVLANLEALLLLSLDLDGGRYPSLPRFIDELKVLRRTEPDDAPDEGELAADERVAADGRVRIMTIHGAKGLEAPLVWLLDAHAAPPPSRAWEVLVGWPTTAPAPTHFSFVGRKDERGAARQMLFEAEAEAAAREELNLLYVALTRAKQLFIASGIEPLRGDVGQSPYLRLQAALQCLGSASMHGATLPEGECAVATGAVAPDAFGASIPVTGARRESPDAAARFGILLHALLERCTGSGDDSRDDSLGNSGWWRSMGYTDAELARVRRVADRLVAAPGLRPFFDPEYVLRAWNELEIADAEGAVCRLDRLVESAEAFWVLDYKSSNSDSVNPARLDDYRAQVANYCRAVAALFPQKPVRGGLIFADAVLVEVFA